MRRDLVFDEADRAALAEELPAPPPRYRPPEVPDRLLERLVALDVWHRPFTDQGDAALFAEAFAGVLLFDTTAGDWRRYDGKRWVPDPRGMEAQRCAKQLADGMTVLLASLDGQRDEQEAHKHVLRLTRKTVRDTLLRDAQCLLAVAADSFDADPDLLNVQNGTLHLPTMTLRPHDPRDKLTRLCGAAFDPGANMSAWCRFLEDVIPHDIDKREYLQKVIGHALLGRPLAQFYLLYGRTTRNGKSTFLETIAATLGDYARAASPETLAKRANRDSRAPSEDLARLAGCRFLRVSEPPEGMVFDAALLKQLTGSDAITARFLHQGSFEYVPQFTLFMNTNYLPRVTDETLFTSERAVVLEFTRHFSPAEQDAGLGARLRTMQDGVLRWMLEGLQRYRAEGLTLPASAMEETQAYANASDRLELFMEDELEPAPGEVLSAKTLYLRYRSWCAENGNFAEGKQRFLARLRTKRLLQDHGTIEGKTVRNVLIGYRLVNENVDIS